MGFVGSGTRWRTGAARRGRGWLLPSILWFLASGIAGAETPKGGADARPTVVLISMDGTRPADIRPDRLPSLVELGVAGLLADGLIPVNPSNTFPNHVSLATGVRPEVHRLVNNSFHDPERGRFKRADPQSWIESEPIWSLAERHDIRSAVYFWVGSEGPWTGGPGPSEFRKFSSRTLEKTKVNRILAWLSEPDPEKRPQLIAAWFHGADHEAHDHGPEADEVGASLAPQDRQIARLVSEMEARGLFETTTLIFVSDHGMTEAHTLVDLGAALRREGVRASVLGIGGFSSVLLKAGKGQAGKARGGQLEKALRVAREAGLEAWPRETAPTDWHVGDIRFGDIVVRAPIGTAIVTPSSHIKGYHGYDAREASMAGILVARGRGVQPGGRVGRISNLSVAPTVLKLLGIPIPDQMKAPPVEEMLFGLELESAAGSVKETK